MTTEHLIATIRADAEAQRDADPQVVIMRLKQDLRAARQAATKARKYAEEMRDGVDQEVRDENERLRALLHEARRQRHNAVRTLSDTKTALFDARARYEALRASQATRTPPSGTSDEHDEPTRSIYELQYIELMRAHQVIRRLLTDNDGRDAAVANRMLAMIRDICEAVDPPKGRRVA